LFTSMSCKPVMVFSSNKRIIEYANPVSGSDGEGPSRVKCGVVLSLPVNC
jgi:hypothetical protein